MNKWLFKIHRWAALIAVLPLVVICTTGSAVVFKYELDNVLDTRRVTVPVQEAGRLGIDELVARVDAELPSHEVVGWQWFDNPSRADIVYVVAHGTSDWQYLTVDPYSGQRLAPVAPLNASLSDWLLDLHYTLLMGDWGMLLSGGIGMLLCISGVSGLILHRKFWTTLPKIRWHSRRVVTFSDLHKVSGAFAAPALLILGFTGAWWNIEHGTLEIREHWSGEAHPLVNGSQYNKQLSISSLVAMAESQVAGFEATYLRLPWEPGVPIALFGRVPTSNPLASDYSTHVTFDAQSGDVLSASDIRTSGFLMGFEDSFRELHFGTFAGMPSRLLWFAAGLIPLALSFTGLWLWWYRRQKVRAVAQKRALMTGKQALRVS